MRDIRDGNCPLCDHHEIVESIPGEFSSEGSEVPSAFTYDQRWVRAGRNPQHPYGNLRYFMCRACGFLQWFVDAPQDVPIGSEHKTRLIKGVERKRDGPYR